MKKTIEDVSVQGKNRLYNRYGRYIIKMLRASARALNPFPVFPSV